MKNDFSNAEVSLVMRGASPLLTLKRGLYYVLVEA